MTPFPPVVGAALPYKNSAERPVLDADVQHSCASSVICSQSCSSLSCQWKVSTS